MAMKQTQTKLFDFSDVGLDFCAGSKNLFPDRFKKMLALGYNEQTVSSVAITGNQVTLSYGVSHGYVADRVLKVNAPELLSINGGEFVIDSVTENTVTMTIDGAPALIAGNFTTKVASLGYQLVYEQNPVQLYKFKALDESDLFLRLVFTTAFTNRNTVSVCIGAHADIATGVITDQESYDLTRNNPTVNDHLKWEFQYSNNATFNNYTYTQGYSEFGRGCILGSKYHFVILSNMASVLSAGTVNGFLPVITPYDNLKLPVILGFVRNAGGSGYNTKGLSYTTFAYLGKISVAFDAMNGSNFPPFIFTTAKANQSYLPATIEAFNTTTARPIAIYEHSSRQHLGFINGGMYECMYANDVNAPSTDRTQTPLHTYDIDLNNKCIIHHIASNTGAQNCQYLAFPVEEIKID